MRSTECPNSLMHRVWTSIAERDLHVYKSDPVHIVTYNKPQSVLTAFNCTASVTVNAGHEQRHSLAGVALYIGAVNGASCVAVWPRPMMQLQRRDGTGRDGTMVAFTRRRRWPDRMPSSSSPMPMPMPMPHRLRLRCGVHPAATTRPFHLLTCATRRFAGFASYTAQH